MLKGGKIMVKIEAIIRQNMLEAVKVELAKIGFTGMTVWEVRGLGRQKGCTRSYRHTRYEVDFLPKVKLELVVADEYAEAVVTMISDAANTGDIGDGKIFISPITECMRIRTKETGKHAIL
jgi:nitrogen regulatory protein P-II 1